MCSGEQKVYKAREIPNMAKFLNILKISYFYMTWRIQERKFIIIMITMDGKKHTS